MQKSRDAVVGILGQQEPDLDFWKVLEKGDVPMLADIAVSAVADPVLAARAVVVAALLDPVAAIPIAENAAQSGFHHLRLAAVSAAEYLSVDASTQIIQQALEESDPALLKFALRVAKRRALSRLKPKIQRLEHDASSPQIRELARATASIL